MNVRIKKKAKLTNHAILLSGLKKNSAPTEKRIER